MVLVQRSGSQCGTCSCRTSSSSSSPASTPPSVTAGPSPGPGGHLPPCWPSWPAAPRRPRSQHNWLKLPPHQQGKGCPSAEQQPTFRLRRRNHLHQPHRLFAHISPSSLLSRITLTSSATVSLALKLSESLFKVTKMHPFKFPADCLSSPAALPPCFVDSLFVFTCSVKDSPTSVF